MRITICNVLQAPTCARRCFDDVSISLALVAREMVGLEGKAQFGSDVDGALCNSLTFWRWLLPLAKPSAEQPGSCSEDAICQWTMGKPEWHDGPV